MRTEPFAPGEVSQDDFLGGALRIAQPRQGYRAGIDPILLAASVPAQAGHSVLELGCGGGISLAALHARVPGLTLHGLEVQPAYAALARDNLRQNQIGATIHTGDLVAPPAALKALSFDHVIANPPFFRPQDRTRTARADREIGRAGDTPLDAWMATASRRLRPRGILSVILTVERLQDVLCALPQVLGSLEILPLCPLPGRAPGLFLLRARKEGRAPLVLHPALALHEGPRDSHGARTYTALVTDILRHGASLPFPPVHN